MSTAAHARERTPGPSLASTSRRIRRDFPILSRRIHGKPLVYLDNAATTQKPRSVLDAERDVYERYYANIHRGVHLLSVESTDAYEKAREKVRDFLHARDSREIVFVRGTTEAINLVASSFGRARVGRGDEVLITALEHHSNIVPWQLLCEEKGARLRVVPMNERGELLLDELARLLTERTRILARRPPLQRSGHAQPDRRDRSDGPRPRDSGAGRRRPGGGPSARRRAGARLRLLRLFRAQDLRPNGSRRCSTARASLLEAMPPYQGGGDMISSVTFEKTTFNVLPYKFEAGTPNIAGVIGLGAALDYVRGIGIESIERHEAELLADATSRVRAIPGVRIIGTAAQKAGVLSFTIAGVHPHDIGTVLDREGVAVRTGHHCAQPVMDFFQVPATARASFGVYNRSEDVDALVAGIHEVKRMFE